MAIPIEFKGIFEKASRPVKTKKGDKYFQKIVVRQPAFTNGYGKKVGQDNFFELLDFRDDPKDFPDRLRLQRSKVKVTAYLNGYENITSSDIFYNVTLRLKELTVVNGKEEAQ